ncbi:succinylarginine dihydrolase, partial [Escherichia coli]|nr:succinylarginine dihydrolase [Escherichia coli]
VFHNAVIAVSNQQVLFHHQPPSLNQDQAFAEIRQTMASIGEDFISIEVPENRVTVDDAVATYLFNSQILTRPDGGMTIVVPEESRQNAAVWSYLNDMIQMGTPIDAIQVYDLRESMRNGGGPACLRLRVALNETELNAVNPKVLMNDQLFMTLNQWVDKHYRDRLA